MAGFADDSAATDLGIVHPHVWRDDARIDPDTHRQRFSASRQQRLHFDHVRREAAVETDHDLLAGMFPGCAHHAGQLPDIQGQGFLDKDMLAGGERLAYKSRVAVVSCCDENRVDGFVCKDSAQVGSRVFGAILLGDIFRSHAVGFAHHVFQLCLATLKRRGKRHLREVTGAHEGGDAALRRP